MAEAPAALDDAGTTQEARFAFGRNWSRFAEGVGAEHLAEAERGLLRLFDPALVRGAEVLDIGCGSGLHAIAFRRLGAARVVGIDIDPDSVTTARRLAQRFEAADGCCRFETMSVFDVAPGRQGRFDIVYSWGVLHHTGAMWDAIATAAAMVRENGHLALAIYKRTPFCGLWRWEKRLYASSGPGPQALLLRAYQAAFALGLALSGRNPRRHAAGFKGKRGMEVETDAIDWLGGYPYESATPTQVADFVGKLGFERVRLLDEQPPPLAGLFGSGCCQFLFRRAPAAVTLGDTRAPNSEQLPPERPRG